MQEPEDGPVVAVKRRNGTHESELVALPVEVGLPYRKPHPREVLDVETPSVEGLHLIPRSVEVVVPADKIAKEGLRLCDEEQVLGLPTLIDELDVIALFVENPR